MNIRRLAAVAALVVTAVVWTPAAVMASDKDDVLAAVNGAVGAFNKGDAKTWVGYCTSPASIISNIAPYQYQGATACADWWSAHAMASKKMGMSDEWVTLGTAKLLVVSAGRAYAAFPAGYRYKLKGKTVATSGNVLTLALKKAASGWMITGWSWSPH